MYLNVIFYTTYLSSKQKILFLLQSFTMFAYISSYMWTLFYSLDVCLQVHNRQSW